MPKACRGVQSRGVPSLVLIAQAVFPLERGYGAGQKNVQTEEDENILIDSRMHWAGELVTVQSALNKRRFLDPVKSAYDRRRPNARYK